MMKKSDWKAKMLKKLKLGAKNTKSYFGLEQPRSKSKKRRRLMSEGITSDKRDEQNGLKIRAPPKLKNPKSCSDLKKIFFHHIDNENDDKTTITTKNGGRGNSRRNSGHQNLTKKEERKRFVPMLQGKDVYSKTLECNNVNLEAAEASLTHRALVTHDLIKRIQEKTGRKKLTSEQTMALIGINSH